MPLLLEFAPVIHRKTTWQKVEILVVGAILATGKRTVSAVLRVMGLSQEPNYAKYHQVLNRAVWSSLAASAILLRLLLKAFVQPNQRLVFGVDETIERRRGEHIQAKGIYRDPVRSSKEHFVKASGLRWVSLMLLTPIAWAHRIWALPFLTVLAASERYYQQRGRKPKKLTDWARQMVFQLRRWLPQAALVVVGDSTYAALEFLHACQTLPTPVTVITRLRLDAALYEPAPLYSGKGRPRKKGQRLPYTPAGPGGHPHRLDSLDPARVQSGATRIGHCHLHCGLVSLWLACGPGSRCPDPRCRWQIRAASLALYRPDLHA
jgi:hypothetical protein